MNVAEKTAEPPTRVLVLERGTEPFSGLQTVYGGGILPEVLPDPRARIEIEFDGVLKSWVSLLPLNPPTGSEFSLQVLKDPGVRRVRIVLRRPDGVEPLIEQPLDEIYCRTAGGTAVPPAEQLPSLNARLRHIARRFARKVRTGAVLRPDRWPDWSIQFAREVTFRAPPPPAPAPPPPTDPRLAERSAYDAHVANNDLSPRRRGVYEEQARAFSYRPTVSILVPVYNVAVRYLRAAVESVRAQVYDNWELCLADDASTDPELRAYLRFLAESDSRFKVVFRPQNGHICAASNSAADLATGDFVAFLDNDDALAPDALFHYVRLLQDERSIDLFYSDEDKIDASGRRYDPQFKPDWSPELFLSYNYVNHFTCVRRELFDRVGRFRLGFEGGQDYDLLWRVVERTDRVRHVPRVLYHWRSLPTSTAAAAAVKPVMFRSCERALCDHLDRGGTRAEPYSPEIARRLRLPISLLDFPDDGPPVAALIPATDDCLPTQAWLAALRAKTSYRRLNVYVIDRTTAVDARRRVRELASPGVAIIRDDEANLSAAINRAVAALTEDLILFLDPSLEAGDRQWLARLAGYAQLPGVGCAGARIVGADGRVRHAGAVLNMYDETAPGRAFEGQPADAVSYYFLAEVARNVAAVGEECLITARPTFLDLGGFAANRFPGGMAAVDYCRRLAARGLRSVYVGGAELRQAGAAPDRDDPLEVLALLQDHGRAPDPYYNPNLSHRFSYKVESGCPHAPELPTGWRAHVLFAAHNLSAATEGAPRYLYDIAVGLQDRGRVRPSVFSPLAGPGAEWYERAGIPVHVGDLPHAHKFLAAKWEPAEYEATLDYAATLLAELRPDVVVANTLCNFPMVEAAARAGVPSVWIIHESYNDEQMRVLHSPYALERCHAAFSLANRVLIASHDTARMFAGVNRRHTIEVVHNGLADGPFEEYRRAVPPSRAAHLVPGPAGRKRITAIGTVCERKGQHVLVEAAAQLRRRGRTDFCVYLVGVRDTSPSYVNALRVVIDRERLHDHVLLIPETGDVRPYLRATDVFVCASHVEAFSRSMLEAESFDLPVVTTPCCGANEQVVWGRNALRFEMGDARQLADHLDRLLGDDDLRLRMGECSRAVYECHLTNEDMLVRYERLILNVWLHAAGQAQVVNTIRTAA